MLNDAQRFLRTAWWLFVFPGAALALTVLSTTLLADGLNESLRPPTNAAEAVQVGGNLPPPRA